HELLAVFSNQADRKGYDIVRDLWQRGMGAGGKRGVGGQGPGVGNTTDAQRGQGLDFACKPILTAPITDASTDFETAWRKAVHDGFIPNTAAKTREGLAVKAPGQGNASPTPNPQPPASGFEIIFRTDPSIYDGRFANNGWLQELPKP